jgi:hypothetical protein
MDETQINLIAEQIKSTIMVLKAEIAKTNTEVMHQKEFTDHRLKQLETNVADHEARIRSATDGVTQFKVFSGLATGGSWIVSAFALMRTWFVH